MPLISAWLPFSTGLWLVVPHIAFCLLAVAGDNFRGRTGLYRATANDLPLLLLNQESFNSWMVS